MRPERALDQAMTMRDLSWRSAWLAGGALLVVLVIALSLAPATPEVVPPLLRDKLGHLVAYFTLMTWFAGIWRRSEHGKVALALIALGLSLEWLQGFTPVRVTDPLDALANTAGVVLALLLARAGLDRWCGVIERSVLGVRRGADV